MKTLLSKANTGEDMLKVLEALTSDAVDDTQEGQYGTLGDIEFWWVDNIGGQNLMSFVSLWVVTVWYTEGAYLSPLRYHNYMGIVWIYETRRSGPPF